MTWYCAIPLAVSLFGACAAPEPLAVGYVEGEFVLLAPTQTARVESISVRKGDQVEAQQPVARLETRDAVIQVEEAEATAEQAAAELENLRRGKRPEEIAVIQASLNSAQAQARESRRKLDRQQDLKARGFASQADFDAAETAVELADARVEELKANLDVARLPARDAEIVAAENRVKQARAALDNARWNLSERVLHAPAAGSVADIILRPGEVAGPTAPVLSILPDGAAKLKLYLPEPSLASVSVGTRLHVRCDGCAGDETATVSYVATDPEFTPPVIYSVNNRQKLVYLIEAAPDASASRLKPGQIVDVSIIPDAEK